MKSISKLIITLFIFALAALVFIYNELSYIWYVALLFLLMKVWQWWAE